MFLNTSFTIKICSFTQGGGILAGGSGSPLATPNEVKGVKCQPVETWSAQVILRIRTRGLAAGRTSGHEEQLVLILDDSLPALLSLRTASECKGDEQRAWKCTMQARHTPLVC